MQAFRHPKGKEKFRRIAFAAGVALIGQRGVLPVATCPDGRSTEPGRVAAPRRCRGSQVSRESQRSFVLVSADALRANYGSLGIPDQRAMIAPRLDALMAEAQVHPVAYTAATWTLPSHMSLFTGLHPHQHGYGCQFHVGRSYPPPRHLLYLPCYLQRHGLATYGFHNGGIMEPGRGLGHGWTEYLGSPPGDVEGPVKHFIEALPSFREPFFAFVHTYAVHNYWGESGTPMRSDFMTADDARRIGELTQRWRNLRWLMAASVTGDYSADETAPGTRQTRAQQTPLRQQATEAT